MYNGFRTLEYGQETQTAKWQTDTYESNISDSGTSVKQAMRNRASRADRANPDDARRRRYGTWRTCAGTRRSSIRRCRPASFSSARTPCFWLFLRRERPFPDGRHAYGGEKEGEFTFRRFPRWACCVSRASEAYRTRHFSSSYSSRPLSPPAKRRYSRRATGNGKKPPQDRMPPLAPGTRAWKKLELSLARATSISLFCCHSSVDRFEVSRRFTKQLIGPSRDMALNQRRGITCRLIARACREPPASRKSATAFSRTRVAFRPRLADRLSADDTRRRAWSVSLAYLAFAIRAPVPFREPLFRSRCRAIFSRATILRPYGTRRAFIDRRCLPTALRRISFEPRKLAALAPWPGNTRRFVSFHQPV